MLLLVCGFSHVMRGLYADTDGNFASAVAVHAVAFGGFGVHRLVRSVGTKGKFAERPKGGDQESRPSGPRRRRCLARKRSCRATEPGTGATGRARRTVAVALWRQ